MPRLIALFESQFRADRCMTELEQHGFTPADIRVILLEACRSKTGRRSLSDWIAGGGIFGDSMDQSDGISVMDGITVGASLGALWGIVWGTRLAWGPVTIGWFGLMAGGLVGLIVDRIIPERRRALYKTKRLKGAILFEVTADGERLSVAQEVLRQNEVDQLALITRSQPTVNVP